VQNVAFAKHPAFCDFVAGQVRDRDGLDFRARQAMPVVHRSAAVIDLVGDLKELIGDGIARSTYAGINMTAMLQPNALRPITPENWAGIA
jgi:hypothetical protein